MARDFPDTATALACPDTVRAETRFRNVFVLCTGRCGSTTFTRAAGHSTNFTAGHETRTHLTGEARFDYPAGHIEADNRLSWLLGRLDLHFGADAFYVHLQRDPDAVAESFVRRADKGIMLAYRSEILMRAPRLSKQTALREFALDYIDTVTRNIAFFLRDKPGHMVLRVEEAGRDFPAFWDRIGAKGPLDRALAEFAIRHNASPEPQAAPLPTGQRAP